MLLKTLLLLNCFLVLSSLSAQVSRVQTFGEPLAEEFALTSYPLDPEATGVVLYERGNYTVDAADGYIRLIKEVHRKIKVFDAKNFDYATFEIPYYRENEVNENIKGLRAVTHNGKSQVFVSDNAIFDIKEGQHYTIKKFTFANVQDGSILEYTYRLETPFLSRLDGWVFMNELPTIYSELHTEIPGNYTYNRTLYGDRKLDVNHAEIKKDCFHLPGFKIPADCESATYAMKAIPAYKEEKYMLSKSNYIPSMKFELRDVISLDESRSAFSKSWDDVDREFRYDKDLGRQLKYNSYFQEQIPASVTTISNELERAKAVYYFIQKNMAWNNETRILQDIRVKEAFEKKTGNSSEINLGLINALEVAGLDAKIMLIATRDRALPTKQYPVLTDFNYAIVLLTINNEKYLLDATEKETPFGVLPFRDLNVEGRVLDFKKGSYWEPIAPIAKNMHYVNLQLSANESGLFSGKVNEVSTGYISVYKRKEYNDFRKDEIIKKKQSRNEFLDVTNLTIENEKDLEQPYKESYDISLHDQAVGSTFFLYPFVMQTYFSENPFSAEKRLYPIDFGFPIQNNYLVSIDVKDQYQIVKVPANKLLKLPENDGELSVIYDVSGSKVNIRLSVKLNNPKFEPEAYKSLQEFFGELIKIQSDEPIELKKI
ncbi:hypothetical protein Aeqsu_2031 [Aequorivita sublithincola DSM 14238]|uniref:Uncharacterized protein n=1 Tax=Aequorivita sublithincola (strain DSM 14238 / LMG 21431 / ACAM 643 / 9-3) TaxID=746697 RepID=I3YWX8_AEQSU|nr:DUF3857 domain-containing protein [Aequorivita sublithincola]AFL81496.1 hypothetical protein Aeqsu_2031 [Aequorivita sublithincola DSM 14238]